MALVYAMDLKALYARPVDTAKRPPTMDSKSSFHIYIQYILYEQKEHDMLFHMAQGFHKVHPTG